MSALVPEEDLAIAHLEQERLEAEVQRLREELRLTTAELHAAGDHLVRLDDEVARLRSGIEKLRDSCDNRWSRKVGLSAQWVARRLTKLLEHGDET